jgi:hypothetical protein
VMVKVNLLIDIFVWQKNVVMEKTI